MELLKNKIRECIEDLVGQIEYNDERKRIFRTRALRLEKALKKYNEWIDEAEEVQKKIKEEIYEYEKLLSDLH